MVTATVPAAWAGATAVGEEALVNVTEVAPTAPKSTVAPVTEPVPGHGTAGPPGIRPLGGETDVRVGAGRPLSGVIVKLAFEMSKKTLPTQETRTRAWDVGVLGIVTVSEPSLGVDAASEVGKVLPPSVER